MYQARILDKNRQIKAVLPGVHWHYVRRINESTAIGVDVPREVIEQHITQDHALFTFLSPTQPAVVSPREVLPRPNKGRYADIASYIQIYKGSTLKVSGKITGRILGQVVTVEAMTEEVLLEGNQTPAQYGKVWDNWDLADVARDLLLGWHTIRVKAAEQWHSYMVDSQNIDLTTDPGKVMLAKRSDGRYYDSGYITLLFDKSEIPDFLKWDRIRWSADSDGALSTKDSKPVVETNIQYSSNGISWSTPFDGGMPEEIGLVPSNITADQLYVRINLITYDTEQEDANEQPTGVTPTVFACEIIARTEPILAEGSIPAVAGVTVKGLSANYDNALNILINACKQTNWEFNVWSGALNLAQALGTDKTSNFVFRTGTNIEITSLGDDDDELCNVLTAYGPGSGLNRMQINLNDEISIAEYGKYPKAVEFEVENLNELEQKAWEYLDSHNTPKTYFEVAVNFDYSKEPEYSLGDMVRVADPETGIVTSTRIMEEQREYTDNGLNVYLGLGKADFTLSEAIAGERKPAKPLDPLQPSAVYARGIATGIRVGFAEPKIDEWYYSEVHVSTASHFEPSGGTLRDKGKQTKFDILELEPGVRYYVRVVHVDEDGRRSLPSVEVSAVAGHLPIEALPDYSIGVDKFMESLKPPIMVTSLPDLPDPRFPADTIVFLTTDGRLYRAINNDWEPMAASDLADLTGKITETQITDEAIKTPHLAANSVTADKLFVNQTMTNKLIAGIAAIGGISANVVTIKATGDKGSMYMNADGLTFKDADGNISIFMSTETGDAFYKGIVEAEAIILPVKPY